MEQKLRQIIRQILLKEYMTQRDLDSIEDYADDLFSDVDVDVEFSSHFLDNANNPRNKEDITPEELMTLFDKTHNKYGNHISHLKSGSEIVFNDTKSDINMPTGINKIDKSNKREMKPISVMRKKDYKPFSNSPKLRV